MVGTRNNRSQAYENGTVESSHRHLKDAADQALMLRCHRDFAERSAYDEFIREVVMRCNRRHASQATARVARRSKFAVRGIVYSAPSSLIGHRLKVRVYAVVPLKSSPVKPS
ncbi:protein of unknown function (plasmid) [Pararobbsia alpina]